MCKIQILSTKGFEFETNDGLNLIEGNVVKFQLKHQPIPHVGWNRVEFKMILNYQKVFQIKKIFIL